MPYFNRNYLNNKMWTTTVSHKAAIKKEKVWDLWTDVPNWKAWDPDVESSKLNGDFQLGTTGELKSKDGPKSKFKITECSNLKSFTNTSNLPLCRMDFIHTMEENKEGIEITHQVNMSGLFTFIFSRIIGKNIVASLPVAVENLIKMANL